MDELASDGAAGEDRRKGLRVCVRTELACRISGGAEAARRALIAAARNIVGRRLGG
jgi:hypothetical protein